jgi:hypothetical protein
VRFAGTAEYEVGFTHPRGGLGLRVWRVLVGGPRWSEPLDVLAEDLEILAPGTGDAPQSEVHIEGLCIQGELPPDLRERLERAILAGLGRPAPRPPDVEAPEEP